MRHPELPVVSFLSIPLLLCSLRSHVKAGSVAIIALIAWLAIVSLIRGVNALVWANNVQVRLEVWCDITTKITVGFTYAVPASTLCVLRHLEGVASTRIVASTQTDKRRRQIFEIVMCFGLPMIGMALHYVVQGHRLDLIEDFGCYPPVYFSVAAIMILWVPPFAMSLTTFGYAALTLRHFLHRRIEFATHLQNSQSVISPARYFRLMAMAVVEMVWDTGVNAYLIYFNSFTGLRPWTTWDNVHSNFSRVAVFPEALIPPIFVTQLIWQWWIVPISCILFFIFFGFGEETMADYRAAIRWLRQTIVRHNVTHPRVAGDSQLPTYRLHNQPLYLSATSFNPAHTSSQIDAKTWDESSLKISEPTTVPRHPSVPDATTYCAPRLADISNADLSTTSLGDLGQSQSTSLDTSPSSFTVLHVGDHYHSSSLSSVVPAIYPDNETLSRDLETLTSSPPDPSSPPVHHSALVHSIPQPTTPDLRITVSPAFRPDITLTASWHEETFSTPDSPSDVLPSCPRI